MTTAPPRRKGFWIRLVATVIDLACVTVLFFGIGATLYLLQIDWVSDDKHDRLLFAVQSVVLLAWTSFEIWAAASPGKAMLGLCVGSVDATPAAMGARVSRWLAKWSPWLLFLLFAATGNVGVQWFGNIYLAAVAIGCLAAMNDAHQAWHDQLAGTAVFRRADVYGRNPAGFTPHGVSR